MKTGKEDSQIYVLEICWDFCGLLKMAGQQATAAALLRHRYRYHDNIPLLDFNIGFLTFYEYYNDFCQMEIDKLIASAFGLSKIVKSCNAFFNKSFLTKEK